jgi:polysaccharide deacetylase 2 family uncharacterized protein YibQ
MSAGGSRSGKGGQGRPRGQSQRREARRLRLAILLLLLIACALVLVLVLLPPREPSARAGGQGVPGRQPGGQAQEEPLPWRSGPPPEQESAAPAGPAASEAPAPGTPGSAGAGGATPVSPAPATTAVRPGGQGALGTLAPPERAERVPKVALLIDDVGYNLDSLEEFLSLPGQIAFSVLPGLPASREASRRIREAGKELWLHMPMEARNGEDPGPVAILTTQRDAEIVAALETAFAQVPGAVGLNNHMGSMATADERVMRVVMRYLKDRGGLFLDSRTTADTVAGKVAAEIGVPYLERQAFLDNDPETEAMGEALEAGVKLAVKQGQAVLIGHVTHPALAGLLRGFTGELEGLGVELVRLSSLYGGGEAQR